MATADDDLIEARKDMDLMGRTLHRMTIKFDALVVERNNLRERLAQVQESERFAQLRMGEIDKDRLALVAENNRLQSDVSELKDELAGRRQ